MNKTVFAKYGDKLLFLAALAVLAAGIIRLINREKPVEPPPPVVPVVVFTHWWDSILDEDVLLGLKNEFESLHGDIVVIFDSKPYEELRRELFEAEPADLPGPDTGVETPQAGILLPGDVFALDALWIPELQKKGIIDKNEAPPDLDSRETEDSPPQIFLFMNVLYYNIDILREAGFARPPRNRSEFLSYAKAVSGNYRWGISMDNSSSRGLYDDIFPWIWSAGITLVNNGRPAVNTRQVIESLTFLASLKSDGLIAPESSSGNARQKIENFVSGRAAFMIAADGDLNYVRERMGDDAFSITLIPPPDNYAGRTFYSTAAWTIGVNPASPYREEARLFADFLAEKAAFLSDESGAMPKNISLQPQLDPFYSKLWDISIAGEAAQELSGLPWTELEKIFREELDALFAEETTPAQAAAVIQRRWEEVIR